MSRAAFRVGSSGRFSILPRPDSFSFNGFPNKDVFGI